MTTQPHAPVPSRTELKFTYIEEFTGPDPLATSGAPTMAGPELVAPARFIAYSYGGGWWRLAWLPSDAAAHYEFIHEFASGSDVDPVTPPFAITDGGCREVKVRAVGADGTPTAWVSVLVAVDDNGQLASVTVNGQWADLSTLPDPHDIRVGTERDSIMLSWEQIGAVTEWGVLWRALDGTGSGQRFVTTKAARISVRKPGRYCVGVIARSGAQYSHGMGVWHDVEVGSGEAEEATRPAGRTGDVPTIERLRVTSTAVTATWQPGGGVRWDAQLLDRRGDPLLGAVVDEAHVTFTDLEPGTGYGVRVSAINALGVQSSWSPTSWTTTRPPGRPDVPTPRTPS
jgi:hypothetical protein